MTTATSIRLHNTLLNWEWYRDTNVTRLFIHLLLKASAVPQKICGMLVDKGQVLTKRAELVAETKLSEQTVRTCLQKLHKTGYINQQSTSKFTIITVCNYSDFKQEKTGKQPAINQQNESVQVIRPLVKNAVKNAVIEQTMDRINHNHGVDAVPLLPQRLFQKVIVQLFTDAQNKGNSKNAKRLRKQAIAYLLHDDDDFEYVCEMAEMNPHTVRKKAKQMFGGSDVN